MTSPHIYREPPVFFSVRFFLSKIVTIGFLMLSCGLLSVEFLLDIAPLSSDVTEP